jgi:hypothetical protein
MSRSVRPCQSLCAAGILVVDQSLLHLVVRRGRRQWLPVAHGPGDLRRGVQSRPVGRRPGRHARHPELTQVGECQAGHRQGVEGPRDVAGEFGELAALVGPWHEDAVGAGLDITKRPLDRGGGVGILVQPIGVDAGIDKNVGIALFDRCDFGGGQRGANAAAKAVLASRVVRPPSGCPALDATPKLVVPIAVKPSARKASADGTSQALGNTNGTPR